jgi:hypothetical protein
VKKIIRKVGNALYALTHRDYVQAVAVLKKRFLDQEERRRAGDPKNLMNFEKCVYSENGEDGILGEIFARVGMTNRRFAEFGAGTGKQNNSRRLLEQEGWSGLWIEALARRADKARLRFSKWPVKVVCSKVTCENIVSLFRENEVPIGLDLLSIDIDGNDYWVWRALMEFQPRVLVIEYNSFFLPGEEWVLPYDPEFVWDATNYQGASLASLAKLGTEQGYELVGCESRGVNAFFVRRDVAAEWFPRLPNPVEHHYVSPKYKENHFGHPPSKQLRSMLDERLRAITR